MRKELVLPLFLIFALPSFSQNAKSIEDFEKSYQKCLDEGSNMYGCAHTYFLQTDSLLNVVYKKIRLELSKEEKEKLRTEQLAWLKKRDAYFEKEYSKLKKNNDLEVNSRDFQMIYYDKQGTFVLNRVKELLKRL